MKGFIILNIVLFGYFMSDGIIHLELICLFPKYAPPIRSHTKLQDNDSKNLEVITLSSNLNNTNTNQNIIQKFVCNNTNKLKDYRLSPIQINDKNRDNNTSVAHLI